MSGGGGEILFIIMKTENRMIRYNLLLVVSIFCLIDAAGSSVHAAEAAGINLREGDNR